MALTIGKEIYCTTNEMGEKWLYSQISEAFGISTRTVERVRERLVQEGLQFGASNVGVRTSPPT